MVTVTITADEARRIAGWLRRVHPQGPADAEAIFATVTQLEQTATPTEGERP